jgi:hypothetical protein
MSRNGSGIYNLPAGNPVVTGTTITSAWANNTLTDIANTLTTSVASDGQTPMTGALNMTTNNINNVGTLAASTVTITNPLAIASGGTNSSATATAGGVTYGTGTAYAFTAVGTSGQVLTSNGSSAPTWSAVTISANTTLTTPILTGAKETQVAVAASNIDLSLGNYFTKTISTTTTFTVSNTASSGTVNSLILDLTNGGSSAVTWWSGVKWASGTAPTLTASGRDVLGFFTEDGGTTWNGFVLGKAMA